MKGRLQRARLHRNLPTRAREGVTRKQQESEPEPSVTEPLLLTVATDCGDESRGVRVDCAAHAVAKDSRSRALISSNLGRPRRRPFLRRTFCRPCAPSLASRSHEQPVRYPCVKPVGFPNHLLSPSLPAPSLSGPVTSGEGRLQVHFAQWGEFGRGDQISPYARARGSDQETALAEPRRLHPKRHVGGAHGAVFETRRLAEEQITLAELAEEFGVSRERVRQIEVSAFEKVQNAVKHRVVAMW